MQTATRISREWVAKANLLQIRFMLRYDWEAVSMMIDDLEIDRKERGERSGVKSASTKKLLF